MPSSTLWGMMPGRQPLEHGRVEVATGGRDGVPRRDDAGTGEPALVDGPGQVDVEQVPTGLHHEAEVAHRREAGHRAWCGSSPLHGASGRRDRPAPRGGGPAGPSGPPGPPMSMLSSMSIRAGQQRHVAQVDLGGGGREVGRVHADDLVPLDDDHRRRAHLTGVDIDPAVGPDEWSCRSPRWLRDPAREARPAEHRRPARLARRLRPDHVPPTHGARRPLVARRRGHRQDSQVVDTRPTGGLRPRPIAGHA